MLNLQSLISTIVLSNKATHKIYWKTSTKATIEYITSSLITTRNAMKKFATSTQKGGTLKQVVLQERPTPFAEFPVGASGSTVS